MTSQLIGRFVTAVEVATRGRHGPGPLTRFAADLVVPDEVRAECSMLKAVAAHYVMLTDERRSVIERQAEIVTGLVTAYSEQPQRLDPDLALRLRGRARRRRGACGWSSTRLPH